MPVKFDPILGKLREDDVNGGDHANLTNLTWGVAGHTIDTDIDFDGNNGHATFGDLDLASAGHTFTQTGGESINLDTVLQEGLQYNPHNYGVKGDLTPIKEVITISGTSLTVVTAMTDVDIGKNIRIRGAGVGGTIPHETTIASIGSGTNITLTDSAPTPISAVSTWYITYTDDTIAFQTLIDLVGVAGGGTIIGNENDVYAVSALTNNFNGVNIVGTGSHNRWMGGDFWLAPNHTSSTFHRTTFLYIGTGAGTESVLHLEPSGTQTSNPIGAPQAYYTEERYIHGSNLVNFDIIGWDFFTYDDASILAKHCLLLWGFRNSYCQKVQGHYSSDDCLETDESGYQWTTSDSGVSFDKVNTGPRGCSDSFFILNRWLQETFSGVWDASNYPFGGAIYLATFLSVWDKIEATYRHTIGTTVVGGDNNYFRHFGSKGIDGYQMFVSGTAVVSGSNITAAEIADGRWRYRNDSAANYFENTQVIAILAGLDTPVPGTSGSEFFLHPARGFKLDNVDSQNNIHIPELGEQAAAEWTSLPNFHTGSTDHSSQDFNKEMGTSLDMYRYGITGVEQQIAGRLDLSGTPREIFNTQYSTSKITGLAADITGWTEVTTEFAHGFTFSEYRNYATLANVTGYNGIHAIQAADTPADNKFAIQVTFGSDTSSGTSTAKGSMLPSLTHIKDKFWITLGSAEWLSYPFTAGQTITLPLSNNSALAQGDYVITDSDVWDRGIYLLLNGTMDINTQIDTIDEILIHPVFYWDKYQTAVYELDTWTTPNPIEFVDATKVSPSGETVNSSQSGTLVIIQNNTGTGEIPSPLFSVATSAKIDWGGQPSPEVAVGDLTANERILMRFTYSDALGLYLGKWEHLDKASIVMGDIDPSLSGTPFGTTLPVYQANKTDETPCGLNLESFGDNDDVYSSYRQSAKTAAGANDSTFQLASFGRSYTSSYFQSKAVFFSNSLNGMVINEIQGQPISFHIGGLATALNRVMELTSSGVEFFHTITGNIDTADLAANSTKSTITNTVSTSLRLVTFHGVYGDGNELYANDDLRYNYSTQTLYDDGTAGINITGNAVGLVGLSASIAQLNTVANGDTAKNNHTHIDHFSTTGSGFTWVGTAWTQIDDSGGAGVIWNTPQEDGTSFDSWAGSDGDVEVVAGDYYLSFSGSMINGTTAGFMRFAIALNGAQIANTQQFASVGVSEGFSMSLSDHPITLSENDKIGLILKSPSAAGTNSIYDFHITLKRR